MIELLTHTRYAKQIAIEDISNSIEGRIGLPAFGHPILSI